MKHSSICSRSITAFFAISASFACVSTSLAQTTATTIPVGFITKTIPAATGAGPSSAVASIPLYGTAAFTSAATVVASNQITLSGAAWSNNQFATPAVAPLQVGTIANPHLLRIKTGVNTGRFFTINANTSNQVTVDLPASVSTLVGFLSVNDSCEIVPANTLASVFGTGANPPALAGGTSTTADQVYLWNGTAWVAYYFNSAATQWRQSGTTSRDNTVVFPDDLIFIVRKSAVGPASLTFMGTVPSTPEVSEVPAGSNAFANRFPVDMTLGGLRLEALPTWVAGTSTTADSVYIYGAQGAQGWVKHYFSNSGTNANHWKSSGTTIRDGESIPVGTGVFIVRSGSLDTLTQALPYTP